MPVFFVLTMGRNLSNILLIMIRSFSMNRSRGKLTGRIGLISVICILLSTGKAFSMNSIDKIIPTPQQVTYTENQINIYNGTSFTACIVKGEKAPQPELEGVYLIQDIIARMCGQDIPIIDDTGDYSAYSTIITLGTAGSNSLNNSLIAANNISLPDNDESYVIRRIESNGKANVLIAGREAIGCYYGATSIVQLISKSGSNIQVREVSIDDWPSLSSRAVKDNSLPFHGDFTLNDAIDWAKFLPKTKMNVFSLCYTHTLPNWRTVPQSYLDAVKALGNLERDRGIIKTQMEINSGYAGGLPVNDVELLQLLNLHKVGLDSGMSQILCAFDDIYSEDSAIHRNITNYLYDRLKGQAGFRLLTCPQAYNFTYPNIASYMSTFTNGLRRGVNVIWTGDTVWSYTTTPAHVFQWRSYTDQTIQWTPYYWHNGQDTQDVTLDKNYQQPDTYYFTDKRVPFHNINLDAGYIWRDMAKYTDQGIIENIFRKFTAMKIYAISMADWAWNPNAYENTTEEAERAKRYWDTVVANPAFMKPATASSSFNSICGPDKLVDGVTSGFRAGNEWATQIGQTVNSWCAVDLGASQTISGVNVYFREFPANKAYSIPRTITVQVSNNNIDWVTVVSRSSNTPVEGGEYHSDGYIYSFNPARARYVKLLFEDGTQNTAEDILEISELEVLTDRPITKTVNFASGCPATASSQFSAAYPPSLAVDNITSRQDDANCWASALYQTVGAWWQVDLGSPKDLRTVRIKFKEFPDNIAYCVPKTITIQSSNDGINWTNLITRSANVPLEGSPYTSQAYSYSVNGTGRYVRLLFEDGSQNALIELAEVEVQ